MFKFSKQEQYIILVLLMITIIGTILFLFSGKTEKIVMEEKKEEMYKEYNSESPSNKIIFVQVGGAVNKPGVYQIKEGTRIYEVVNLAQPTADADMDSLNLVQKLTDGQKIVVPSKTRANSSSVSSQTTGNLININTADISELDRLPGIGPAFAQRIIDYRNTNGPFKSIEEIKNVPGIGEKKFSQIKDLITI